MSTDPMVRDSLVQSIRSSSNQCLMVSVKVEEAEEFGQPAYDACME